MRTNRLIAITVYLLNRQTVSAAALAEHFEVSKRTIQRDIEALNQAGVPIVSIHGARGGYEIMAGFGLSKQAAGPEDCANILTALKGLRTALGIAKIDATLEKALSVLRTGEQKVFVDFSAAREIAQVNEYLRVIEKAVQEKIPLRIEYSDSEMALSVRVIEPLALSYQWHAWYVFAYCTKRKDYRTFKLARMSRCEPVERGFSREHEDAATLMSEQHAPDPRTYCNVRLLCKREIRQQVQEYMTGNIVEERDNGDFVLRLHAPMERMWFSMLMGFGGKVRVLEPDELKAMLAEKAKEILSVYENDDS